MWGGGMGRGEVLGGIGVAMKKGAREAIPGTHGSSSAEVESWFLELPVLRLRVDVPGVPASLRVPPSSPRGSDRRGRGATRGGAAAPSPLAVPCDPICPVGMLRGFACLNLPAQVFIGSAAQLGDRRHTEALGGDKRGLVVAVVVEVPEAPAPVLVSPRSAGTGPVSRVHPLKTLDPRARENRPGRY